MFTLSALVVTFSLFISSEAGFVDTLPKCSIKDTNCIKGVFQHILKTVGTTGVEEIEIAPLDPMDMSNIALNIIKDVTFTITEGTAKGMTNCVFDHFNIDWETERAVVNVTCDALSLKGKFVISGQNAEIQSVIGSNTLNGQGRAKIKLGNVKLNIEYTMYASKKDGDIHLTISNKNIKYTYDIGKAHFITENVIIANNDLTQFVASYLNDNWRPIMNQFGPAILDKALELFVALIGNICDKIPANKYIIEDLNSYIKN